MSRALHWAMVREVFAAVLAFFGMILALHLCTGCKGPEPKTAEQAAAEAGYGAALLDCVDKSTTLAESKACRARVDAAWGVIRKDTSK